MTFKEIAENWDLWLVTVFVLLALVTLIVLAVKGVPLLKKFVAFLNDVAGEEARPGRERVPGLFERISSMEQVQQTTLAKVEIIHHEVFPNSGKSLRDQTNRIEAKVSKDFDEITNLKHTVQELSVAVEAQSTELAEHIEVSTGILNTLNKE